MAAKAFVFVETAVGKTKEVNLALKKMKAIKSVDVVTGPYDIIIIMEGENPDTIGTFVADKVQAIPGIVRTVTCLSLQIR
jgi:DNA-binding Lrp family transcriptional regulator